MMLWGADEEMSALEKQNKICSAMYDSEKDNPKSMTKDLCEELAEITSLNLSDALDVRSKYR